MIFVIYRNYLKNLEQSNMIEFLFISADKLTVKKK